MFHKDCNGQVYIDLTHQSRILAQLRITWDGIVINCANLVKTTNNPVLEYFCAGCSKNIPAEEIFEICTNCGEKTPLLSLHKTELPGEILCRNCAAHSENRNRPVTRMLSNFNF